MKKKQEYDVEGSNIRNGNGWIYFAAGILFFLLILGMFYLMGGIAWKTHG